MMAKDDGGRAFPRPYSVDRFDRPAQKGMTLRDWFAGQAVAGWLPAFTPRVGKPIGPKARAWLASCAYLIADAMIAEREK